MQFSTITIVAMALFASNAFASPTPPDASVTLSPAEANAVTAMYNNMGGSLPRQ